MLHRVRFLKHRFSLLPRALQLIWNAAHAWTMSWAILLIIGGVLPAASVYLTKLLVDSIVVAIEGGGDWEAVRPLIVFAGLMGFVMLASQLIQSLLGWVRVAQGELVGDYIRALIHEKAIAVDFAFYESPKFYDQLNRVSSEANSRPLALLENIGGFVKNCITFLAMGAILFTYGFWLPLALLISTVPAFWVAIHFKKQHHAWWEGRTEDRRRTKYYEMMLTNSFTAAEIRIFDLGSVFRPAYQKLRATLRYERLDLEKRQMLAKLGANIYGMLVALGAMAWIGWRALRGTASLGDLALFYQAFNQGQNLMRGLMESLSQLYSNVLFLHNLFEYLDQKTMLTLESLPAPSPDLVKEKITLDDVTFYYPGSEHPALQNFNMTIEAGQTIAIVGENGAGKSTLLKLLMRFYDPQSGAIKIDGVDLRDMPIEQLWRMNTVLFQFPVQYHATATENIVMGDHHIDKNPADVEQAARSAGMHEKLSALPEGYDTPLGKWFLNGQELSGGEWQRLAMARAFFRKAPIIILDEPTSMMDSWAEAEWFERASTLAKGRIMIIITHRFTIARRADIIHVMRAGKIEESGSHEELLQKGGLYMQSWNTQVEPDKAGKSLNSIRPESDASIILEQDQ